MKLTILLLCAAGLVPAQDNAALKKEIEALREGQKAIQKDLEEIKALLKSRPAAAAPPTGPALQNVLVSSDGVLVRGDLKAPVTIIEYTDLQCPFCSRHAQGTFSQIENEYVKSGKVRYIVKDFPLESIHPNAFKAAEAGRCAAELDKTKAWDMHDRLFANQQRLGPEQLPQYADALGLDVEKFKACLSSGKFAEAVRKDMAEAQGAGVTGTPAFLIGVTDPKTLKMKPQKSLTGAQAFNAFKAAIDGMLPAK
ncbi:MAG: DsbA family protein [Bryobacteraceae bacterium]|nr:DsbA family protein [Bryobacteraceae bacterium]